MQRATPITSPAAVKLPPRAAINKLVNDALREDIGRGDITAELIDASARADAQLICREDAVLCGREWFARAFMKLDNAIKINWHKQDGERIAGNELICAISGNARAIVTAERVAINLLQTLSATATCAHDYAQAVKKFDAIILDTRKTIPGMRLAQKYAAAVGGARNHRFGLFDKVLIKENHIHSAGGIANAMNRMRAINKTGIANEIEIEIEVESVAQFKAALAAGAARILCDNFTVAQLKECVALARGRVVIEASGNINRAQAQAVAAAGVDYISIGAITKHIRAIDFSLRIKFAELD